MDDEERDHHKNTKKRKVTYITDVASSFSPSSSSPSSDILNLNIGGTHFDVHKSTLQQIPFFEHLWSNSGSSYTIVGPQLPKDRNDRIFVDRDSSPFADILTYLRAGGAHGAGKQCLSRFTQERLQVLQVEAEFFCYD
jgi:hypothetical protein